MSNFLYISAVLAAGAPHIAPFMADECLLAMPEVDGLDYTMKEYMRFVEYVKSCVERLNSLGKTENSPALRSLINVQCSVRLFNFQKNPPCMLLVKTCTPLSF